MRERIAPLRRREALDGSVDHSPHSCQIPGRNLSGDNAACNRKQPASNAGTRTIQSTLALKGVKLYARCHPRPEPISLLACSRRRSGQLRRGFLSCGPHLLVAGTTQAGVYDARGPRSVNDSSPNVRGREIRTRYRSSGVAKCPLGK